MAAHHLDEGVLGWVYAAAALIGGLSACGITAYLGARAARAVDNARVNF